MKKKRDTKHLKYRLIQIMLLVLIVFIIGIIIGKNISSSDLDELSRQMRESELNTESFLVEQQLFGMAEDNCEIFNSRIVDLARDLDKIGTLLTTGDPINDLGKENYFYMKKKYHLMQVRFYLLYKQVKETCNVSKHMILYFYSIDHPESKEQGYVLDELVQEYPVIVLAIEYNFTRDLDFLQSSYRIEDTPSMVIDYDTTYQGLTGYEMLEDYLNTSTVVLKNR
jgi:hypothetical protein